MTIFDEESLRAALSDLDAKPENPIKPDNPTKQDALELLAKFSAQVESGEIENVILIGYNISKDHSGDGCNAEIRSGSLFTNEHALRHAPDVMNSATTEILHKLTKAIMRQILGRKERQ